MANGWVLKASQRHEAMVLEELRHQAIAVGNRLVGIEELGIKASGDRQ